MDFELIRNFKGNQTEKKSILFLEKYTAVKLLLCSFTLPGRQVLQVVHCKNHLHLLTHPRTRQQMQSEANVSPLQSFNLAW